MGNQTGAVGIESFHDLIARFARQSRDRQFRDNGYIASISRVYREDIADMAVTIS